MRSAGKILGVVCAAFFLQRCVPADGLAQEEQTDVPHEEQIFELRILDGESRGLVRSAEVWFGREGNEKRRGDTTP